MLQVMTNCSTVQPDNTPSASATTGHKTDKEYWDIQRPNT